MLKRFFISFLGAVSAFWFSIVLLFVVLIVMIAVAGVSTGSGVTVKSHSILVLDLNGEITDRPVADDPLKQLYGVSTSSQSVTDLVTAIDAASRDDRIDGILINAGGVEVGLASAQALINAIEDFKKGCDKWVYAYGDSYTQGDYFIACHADSVFLNPIGMVDIHGLASTGLYFKNLLDNLGIDMQVLKVGTYKSAVEPYMLTEMSEPARRQMQIFLDNFWTEVRTSIASARGITPETVNSYADSVMMAVETPDLLKMKLVDGLKYRNQLEELLMAQTNTDDRDDLRYVDATDYSGAPDIPLPKMGKEKHIAVLYAVGEIYDSGEEGIVGDAMVDEILALANDDDVDGLILRVNSPGGSAFASEQIWQALEQFKAMTGKPFYVSMGDYAASGGYYISCGADKIFAEPLTLTGSIGIFGIIPNFKGTLSDKLGINTSTVTTNPNAAFPTIFAPMTEQQRAAMQKYINHGYETFVGHVAQGRNMSVDSVKVIAEGRVWDGREGLRIGLVDQLGGLNDAIAAMAEKLGVAVSDCSIDEYPELNRKWWQELLSMSGAKVRSLMLDETLTPEEMQVYRDVANIRRLSTVQARVPLMIIQ